MRPNYPIALCGRMPTRTNPPICNGVKITAQGWERTVRFLNSHCPIRHLLVYDLGVWDKLV